MENKLASLLEGFGISNTGIVPLSWIIIVLILAILFIGSNIICQKIVLPIVHIITRKTSSTWDDIILNEVLLKCVCNLAVAIIITALQPLVLTSGTWLYTIVTKILWIYIVVLFVKITLSLFSSFYLISSKSEKTKNHTLQGVFQMLKILSISIGLIIVASIAIDKNPMTLLAGLGASAAVLMLVFKDSIMGLVAGIQLSANDMLRPGDWICMPKHGADGNVIDVTLTTVKVQNWDKTIITIPPYALVSDSFQNWRGMQSSGGRRIKRSIFIDMNSIKFCDEKLLQELIKRGIIKEEEGKMDKVNLTLFREWLENWLTNHPDVNKDMIIMVRQLQPTALGLPLELYFFFNGIMWVPYEHTQSDIFEYVFAILPLFGLKVFQSPSGTDISNNNGRIPSHLF